MSSIRSKYSFEVTGFCDGCKKDQLGMKLCPRECFHVHFCKLMKESFKGSFEKMFIASGGQFNKFYFFSDDGQGVLITVKKVKEKESKK